MRRLKPCLLFWTVFFLAFRAEAQSSDRFATTLGLTYASAYMTDGFRVGDSSPVVQTSLRLELPRSDFSLMYWNSLRANRSKSEFDEHDFMALFNRDVNENSRYAFNLHGFYDYWTFPHTKALKDPFGDRLTNGKFHGSKLNAGVSMTKLIPLAGSFLVPSYNVYYWIYWAQDRKDLYRGGARHEFSLHYSHALREFSSTFTEPYLGLSTSTSYNDGAFGVRPGMSHSLAVLYAGVKALGLNLSLSANQQFSHQRTVNTRNDFWVSFSVFRQF